MYRDGLEYREAIEILRDQQHPKVNADEFEDLADQLPQRNRRVFVELSTDVLCPDDPVDQRLIHRETERSRTLIQKILRRALSRLEKQDRVLFRLHFEAGQSIAAIARALDLDQRALYRRRDKCLGQLRTTFERRGVSWNEVAPLVQGTATELKVPAIVT